MGLGGAVDGIHTGAAGAGTGCCPAAAPGERGMGPAMAAGFGGAHVGSGGVCGGNAGLCDIGHLAFAGTDSGGRGADGLVMVCEAQDAAGDGDVGFERGEYECDDAVVGAELGWAGGQLTLVASCPCRARGMPPDGARGNQLSRRNGWRHSACVNRGVLIV